MILDMALWLPGMAGDSEYLVHLQTDASKFFIFLFTACTFNMTVGAISMTLAILIMNSGAASLVINIVILVSLLFANFPANAGTIPAPLSWINHISFIGYGLRIMAVNEIDGSVFQIKVRLFFGCLWHTLANVLDSCWDLCVSHPLIN